MEKDEKGMKKACAERKRREGMRWKVEKKQGGHGGKREERTW